MLSASSIRRIGAYSVFLKRTAKASEFSGLGGPQRAKAQSKAFKNLTVSEKKSMAYAGQAMKFTKKIHGHSGFQFYLKLNGGIIDEKAVQWQKLSMGEKSTFRAKGKFVPVIKRANKPAFLRRPLSGWAIFLKKNKKQFKGCTGREALELTRKLAKEFRRQ